MAMQWGRDLVCFFGTVQYSTVHAHAASNDETTDKHKPPTNTSSTTQIPCTQWLQETLNNGEVYKACVIVSLCLLSVSFSTLRTATNTPKSFLSAPHMTIISYVMVCVYRLSCFFVCFGKRMTTNKTKQNTRCDGTVDTMSKRWKDTKERCICREQRHEHRTRTRSRDNETCVYWGDINNIIIVVIIILKNVCLIGHLFHTQLEDW
jgi:hypothetical protein